MDLLTISQVYSDFMVRPTKYSHKVKCVTLMPVFVSNLSSVCLQEGAVYQSAVFNETIQVVEPDEGLDGETYDILIKI